MSDSKEIKFKVDAEMHEYIKIAADHFGMKVSEFVASTFLSAFQDLTEHLAKEEREKSN